MTIIGILVGIALIAGLILAMGKMSEQGIDINDHFCRGNCSDCSSGTAGDSCTQYPDLEKLDLNNRKREA